MNDHNTAQDHNSDLPVQNGQGDEKKLGLPKPPLFTSDYIAMAEILEFALDRFGKLVLALMYYTTDGTIPDDLPQDLNMMFSIYRRKVDAAREKYGNVCRVRAESGAKGGKAKAENAKKKADGVTFNPPTLKQFREAVDRFVDDGSVSEDTSSYDIDSFFDELRESKWAINGEPLQRRHDWEEAVLTKFYGYKLPNGIPQRFPYLIFAEIFATHHGLRDDTGRSCAVDAQSDFFDTYDESSKTWVVQGEQFPIAKWREALARFMDYYGDSSKC